MWHKEVPKNYKLISLLEGSRNGHHVLVEEENCLYKVFTVRNNKGGQEVASCMCITKGCKCRGKTIAATFTRTSTAGNDFPVHNHQDHKHKADAEVAYAELKTQVLETRRNIRELYREKLRNLSPEAARQLTWKKVGTTLKRLRRSIFPGCGDKKAFELLFETNEAVIETYGEFRGKAFYQGTVGDENGRASVFVISQHLEQLDEEFCLYADGTFNIIPLDFSQLYVLLADFEGKPRPLAFILMDCRDTKIYKHIFYFLRNGLNLNPKQIMIDFESAPRKAIKEIWPSALVTGCNFHFVQAVWRKSRLLEELKIVKIVKCKNDTAKTILKMYTRLSLLPLEKIDEGVKAIEKFQQQVKLESAFQRFRSYFKTTWLDGRYKKEDWCVSSLDHRTNNYIEAYNSMMKDIINRSPSVYDFLEFLQDLCYKSNNEFESDIANGFELKSRSKITATLKKKLEKLKKGNITVKLFLIRLSAA